MKRNVPTEPGDVLPGSGLTGDRLWSILTDRYDLEPVELVLLGRIRSALNRADQLDREVQVHGLLDPETGKPTPAAVESRLVGQEAAKLLAGLNVPTEDAAAAGYRPSAPRGPRGPYGGGRRREQSALRPVSGGRS